MTLFVRHPESDALTVEVYDESADEVLTFLDTSAAERFGLTGDESGATRRAARPEDRVLAGD